MFPLPGCGPGADRPCQIKIGPGLELPLAARAALLPVVPGQKRKRLEDLFAQSPGVPVHRMADPGRRRRRRKRTTFGLSSRACVGSS